jgi:trans-AT polyketide synthase, acyltransferase and oxidoreductase domains
VSAVSDPPIVESRAASTVSARPADDEQARSAGILSAVAGFRDPTHLLIDGVGRMAATSGRPGLELARKAGWTLQATLAPIYPEWLGDADFNAVHRTRFPYVVGEMANGIATVELVTAAAQAGCIGFFGAAGLAPGRVEGAIEQLDRTLGSRLPWGSNLIHSPAEPALETAVADLYIRRGVRRVSASAFMALTPAVVRYAYSGIRRDRQGEVRRANHVFAKISHPGVARQFMEPAPAAMLDQLVGDGLLDPGEAALGATLPVAEDVTVEGDSGGHTDNRPLGSLFPTIAQLRDEIARLRSYRRPIRVGAAGGIGTPSSVAAALGMGAAYVLTGSINQAAVESGLHPTGRAMLASADITDVMMAPAADMFELGVNLQVLKRGTMFGVRARKLYDLYAAHPTLEALSDSARKWVEQEILRQSVPDAWRETRAFWADRDPTQVERAERDPRHKLALVFRSYLGLSSRWAIAGEASRTTDYQIWCGPAMGAFNAWTEGTFLAQPGNRTVAQIAANLMEGAAVVTRASQLRSAGLPVPAAAFDFRPRPLSIGPASPTPAGAGAAT